jgi:MFS family permease
VIYAIAGVLPIFLSSLTAIIISRIVVGAMESAVVTASTTLIGDYFHGEAREKWLANQTALASISSIFLALIGGVLGNLGGWRAPFAVYAIGLLYAVGIVLWTWEPSKAEQPSAELAGPSVRFPWRTMVPIALLAVFGGVMFFMMQIQVSNLLNDYYGISSPATLGLFTGTAGLSVAAGTIAYRRMARSGIATQLLVAFGLLGVSYVMMDHAPSAISLTVWLVANQLGCGILLPSLVVLVMARLPFEVRGRGTGVFMTAWWLGQPLSTQLAAWVRQLMGGSLPAALQIFGILCLLAATAALASRAATRRPAAAV